MDIVTVKRLIRRAIREPKPKKCDDDDLEQSIGDGISLIGQALLASEPDYFRKRISLTSDTNLFTLPSDLDRLLAVWDMETNALTVSGAADNGSGLIRITTSAVHGKADDDIVTIHDVLGTTEANGTWKIDVISTTTFDLVGSTFANTWTSGGKCFQEDTFDRIVRMEASEANGLNSDKWYLEGSKIVVDDPTFTYDIVINYRYVPSSTIATALTEIPSKFHFGLVSYCVLDLISLTTPASDNKEYPNYKSSQKHHEKLWQTAWGMISDFKISKESKSLADVTRIKRRI